MAARWRRAAVPATAWSPAACRWKRSPANPRWSADSGLLRGCARNAAGRRIFEVQRLTGMDQWVDRVRRHGRFREAAEDQLQLAGVIRDVADREDARRT